MSGNRLTIEIVGVAGSGKSTLARALRSDYGCRIADSLHTRLPAHWPYVVHGLPGLAPLVVANARERPMLSWDELKFVLYAAEWHRFLRAERTDPPGAIVLDQGPMFALACLLWGHKPVTRGVRFESWQRRMVERWSLELDAIALLDAPDEILLARIDEREQGHDVKGAHVADGLELVERHREAYGRVLELIQHLGRPRLLRYDTATMPPAAVAAELAETLELDRMRKLTETPRDLNVLQGRSATREGA
jgi:adenylate kinase family enzyme